MALSVLPGARQGQLVVLIDDYSIFHHQVNRVDADFVVIHDHVAQRLIFFIFEPVALTSDLRHQIGGKAGSLGIGAPRNQVLDVVGLVQEKGPFECGSMHESGVLLWSIRSGSKPGTAVFNRHLLGYGEGPVQGVQFRMPIYTTVVSDVGPDERTKVTVNVPLLLPLQELEVGRLRLVHRSSPDAAGSSRDAAVRLDIGGVRTVVSSQVIPLLDESVAVAEHLSVSQGRGAPNCYIDRCDIPSSELQWCSWLSER